MTSHFDPTMSGGLPCVTGRQALSSRPEPSCISTFDGILVSGAAGCGGRRWGKDRNRLLASGERFTADFSPSRTIRGAFDGGAGGQDHLAVSLRRLLETGGAV